MAMSRRFVLPIAGASLAAMLAASPVLAQPRDQAPPPAEARAHPVLSARIGAGEAVRIAEQAGYRGIHEVEWERGVWEIDAFDTAGARVELYVDAQTGALVRKGRR